MPFIPNTDLYRAGQIVRFISGGLLDNASAAVAWRSLEVGLGELSPGDAETYERTVGVLLKAEAEALCDLCGTAVGMHYESTVQTGIAVLRERGFDVVEVARRMQREGL